MATSLKVKEGKKKMRQMNEECAQDILTMSRTHHTYMSFIIFLRVVLDSKFRDQKIKDLLLLLAKVFALKQLQTDAQACYETGFFGRGSKLLMSNAMKALLVELRPHMIPLIELTTEEVLDHSYASSIGNKYGDIYEKQLTLAMNSKLS